MNVLADAWRLLRPPPGDRHGPLSPLLLLLTVVTGLVDAFSYLALGHVFVANATGNIAFLAFALAGAHGFSAPASLLAIAAFAAGALSGGWLINHLGVNRGRLLAFAASVEALLAAVGLLVALTAQQVDAGAARFLLITLLGAAMGLQNATARKLAVPDLTTTVLTLTITGIAADAGVAGGRGSRLGRRLPAVLGIFVGGLAGALLVESGRSALVLVVAPILMVAVAATAARLSASNPPWVREPN
jgi:uncharacterized membrane protein YoaK (UPF0700 family)